MSRQFTRVTANEVNVVLLRDNI